MIAADRNIVSLEKKITSGWKNYDWYGDWPKTLLTEDYPQWRKKWTPDRNVLERK